LTQGRCLIGKCARTDRGKSRRTTTSYCALRGGFDLSFYWKNVGVGGWKSERAQKKSGGKQGILIAIRSRDRRRVAVNVRKRLTAKRKKERIRPKEDAQV